MYKKIETDLTKKTKKLVEETFARELSYIKHDDVKNFATEMLRLAPGYFFTSPSSTSGKYHPDYENSKGGLVLHTKAVIYYLIKLFDLDMFNVFSSRDKDLLIVSALLHDFRKNGDNPHCEFSKFDHPRIAANFILNFKDCGIISASEITFIADAIKSHMGQWNAKSKNSSIEPLDLPETNAQKVLHICDYLASRQEVDLSKYLFDKTQQMTAEDVKDSKLTFGKYKGKKIGEVLDNDAEYLDWCYSKNIELKNNKEKTFMPLQLLEGLRQILYVENVD